VHTVTPVVSELTYKQGHMVIIQVNLY